MSITSTNELDRAISALYTDFTISKAAIANGAVGQYISLWRATGLPGQGAIPTGVGVGPQTPDNTTTGALNFTNRTLPQRSYISSMEMSSTNPIHTLEIHDRLAHQGGFVGNVTTSQIAAFDFNALLISQNLDARKGDTNYSDIQWWLEWYTDTGATASNATINVVFNDGTSGNLTVVAVGGTVRAGRMIPLNSLIASADQGKFIRGINNITLSASTGTAGNFGITATRYRCSILARSVNVKNSALWDKLGFPEILASSCLFPVTVIGSGTTSGTVQSKVKMVYM